MNEAISIRWMTNWAIRSPRFGTARRRVQVTDDLADVLRVFHLPVRLALVALTGEGSGHAGQDGGNLRVKIVGRLTFPHGGLCVRNWRWPSPWDCGEAGKARHQGIKAQWVPPAVVNPPLRGVPQRGQHGSNLVVLLRFHVLQQPRVSEHVSSHAGQRLIRTDAAAEGATNQGGVMT